MANPDDERFESFIEGVMNTTMSSALNLSDSDFDMDDVILHNLSESDNESVSDSVPFDAGIAGTSTPRKDTRPRPTPPDNDEWVDVTDFDQGPPTTIPIYNVNSGPNLPSSFHHTTKPIDYFLLFFNDELMKYICDETNYFANLKKSRVLSPHSRLQKWEDISEVQLKAFLGTIINMGLINLSNITHYFSSKWVKRMPFFSDVFSKDEFLNLFWNIHFNHNEQPPRTDKGFLIRPIVDHIRKMCQLFYIPSNSVAIDESTVSFKGKISFRVYNPQKPTKFGMKLFVASDCENGYIFNFIPYFGKETLIPDSNLLKTTQIVKVLSESIVYRDVTDPKRGLHIYTDRYYTSPELASELMKINTNLTGTVMTHRVGMPRGLKAKYKKMKKGDLFSFRKGNTVVVSWKDKRVVTLLSTKSKGSKRNVTDVPNKWPNQPPVTKPDVVIDYTKHMGAVDRSDHFISNYQFMRKTKKWYRKIFFWLLEVAIVNSYLLYCKIQKDNGRRPQTHEEFRESLVEDLVSEKANQRREFRRARRAREPAPEGPAGERLQGRHFQYQGNTRRRCVVCYKKGLRRDTPYYCKTCTSKPAIHVGECFEAYHTKLDF